MNDNLTPKQEKFIQNVVSGMTQRQAYKEAFQVDYDDNAIDSNASTLFNSAKIQQRYKELMEKLEDKAIMSAKERMIWLTEVVKGIQTNTTYGSEGQEFTNEAYISDKMKAIDILNKMSGEYVTKLEGDIGITSIKVDVVDE